MARGNTSRIASTLSAIAQGDAPPPELEVARMPRTGTALTHRLLVLFSGAPVVNPGWLATNSSIRASAEPMLNAWASKLLGNATKVRCTIERLDATGAVAETRRVPLNTLLIGPLDVVYGVETDTGETPPIRHAERDRAARAVPGEAHRRRLRPAGESAPAACAADRSRRRRDDAVRRAGAGAGAATAAGARARRRSGGSQPARARGDGTIDLADLETRVVRAENGLNAAHKQLAALVAKSAATTAETFRAAVLKLGGFGVGPAVPTSAAGESPAAVASLVAQAKALMKTSGPRLDQAPALRARPAAADPRARQSQLVDRMRAVFGQAFVVLPRFSCDAASSAELTDRAGGEHTGSGRRSAGCEHLVYAACPCARPGGPGPVSVCVEPRCWAPAIG